MYIQAILLAMLVCLLSLHFLKLLQAYKKYFPGPSIKIFLGIAQSGFRVHPHLFTEAAKKYGNIYSIWGGYAPLVVLSGLQAIKEALIKHSENFSGRSVTPFFKVIAKEKGIVFSNGHTWKQQRTFGVATMRKLGMGKTSVQSQIREEAHQLVETFANAKGQPLDPSLPIINFTSGVISVLVFGHRFSAEDEEFRKLVKVIVYNVKFGGTFFHLKEVTQVKVHIDASCAGRGYLSNSKFVKDPQDGGKIRFKDPELEVPVQLYEMFPRLMKHIKWPYKKAFAAADFVLSQARKETEKHRAQKALHEPCDFIDYYLLQMERNKNNPTSTYNDDNLFQCISDFFIAGTDTTSSAVQWLVLLMVIHQDIQEKVQKEIEDVFGCSQAIRYEDRKEVPYTFAVIHEALRFKCILLTGNPRQCLKDVNILGSMIPKGSIVIPDVNSVLYDPTIWETPRKFNPNHFLDKDGKFVDREELLVFGAGARMCPGKDMVKMELFLLFTNLLRAFTLKLPEGVKEVSTEPVLGLTLTPQPYKLCAVPRNSAS